MDTEFYGRLKAKDFWEKGKKLIGNGWKQTLDGKLTPMFELAAAIDSPWCHAVIDKDRDCLMWHKILYDTFGLLPSPCLECWKVVARPNNLEQLFSQYELQKRMGYASKSGIEVRNYVHGLYGVYWYTNSLEEGQDRWKEVKDVIHKEISPDIEVVLKRACTEFEMTFGPSTQWAVIDEQLEFEELVYEMIVNVGKNEHPQTPEIIAHVQQRWVDWAYSNGDPTCFKYARPEELGVQTVKFHDLDLSKLETKTIEVVKSA